MTIPHLSNAGGRRRTFLGFQVDGWPRGELQPEYYRFRRNGGEADLRFSSKPKDPQDKPIGIYTSFNQ
jgi:hypothetical protein